MGRLDNKVAMITGAASGMGAAGAMLFAREGACVVVADVDERAGHVIVERIIEQGGRAEFARTDVTSEQDNRRLTEIAVERFGQLNIVWANAGIAQQWMPIEDTSPELFQQLLAVNAIGPWLTIRESLPALKASGRSSVIITGSLSGVKARPLLSPYQASKAAALMLVKSLALELAPFGARVNGLAPIATDTPMLPKFGAGDNAKLAAAIPLGRLAMPEDVAQAALFLASDESAFITGTTIFLDGGASA